MISHDKMVVLRKQGNALEEIANEFSLSVYEVSTILKEELGDAYAQYSLKKKWILTPEEVNKIVALRRSYYTVDKIARQLKVPPTIVSRALSKELKEEDNLYSRPNSYKAVKNRSKEKLQEIINLRNAGNTIADITDKTEFTKGFITWFLADLPGEHLKVPQIRDSSNVLSEKGVLPHLASIYNFITARILTLKYSTPADSPAYNEERKKFKALRSPCVSKFRTMWNSLPLSTPYRSPDILCLPFISCFFRANNIYLDATLFLRHYGYSKHKWFQCLKKIHNHLPGYIHRDRKQVVLEKIKELMNFFKLSDKFYSNAEIITNKLWKYLHNTTDNVIVGIISVLSLFSINDDSVRIFHISQRIRISQSAVIYQITNKILKPLRISGFTTLKTSKELLQKELLEKIVNLKIANTL